MIGQERLNRLEGKIDAINENVQGTTPANPQAPMPDAQMDPASNGTGSARPVFTQQTANDLDQINRGDAMSNVLFNKQQGASMKSNGKKLTNIQKDFKALNKKEVAENELFPTTSAKGRINPVGQNVGKEGSQGLINAFAGSNQNKSKSLARGTRAEVKKNKKKIKRGLR